MTKDKLLEEIYEYTGDLYFIGLSPKVKDDLGKIIDAYVATQISELKVEISRLKKLLSIED